MLKREIDSRLREWKADKNHKALLLTGARQIGKTYSVRKFAEQEYENFVEINFIENESAQDIFSDVSNREAASFFDERGGSYIWQR